MLQYEDEDRDKVVLASDDELTAAVDHARLAGWKACTNNTADRSLNVPEPSFNLILVPVLVDL